jgi:hypothetical protein
MKILWTVPLFIGVASGWLYTNVLGAEPPIDEQVYHTQFGATICGHRVESKCGVSPHDCADGYNYRCLTNVRWEQRP